ncbi:MAG TPA: oligogalacturonate lyase family protein [Opitutaceae bacterium]|nr:oligogalacturonate lyase family protein [Opitutaceae bacterium]
MKNPLLPLCLGLLALLPARAQNAAPAAAPAPAPAPVPAPPKSWIDPDTGHRVIRLSDDPGTASLYFNDNGYTPDGKEMIFTRTGDGAIGVIDLQTYQNRIVVQGPVRAICVGHKTNTVFYLKGGGFRSSTPAELWSTNLDTGEARKLATLPPRASVDTVNADETAAAGTYTVGDMPERAGGRRGGRPGAAAGGQGGPMPAPVLVPLPGDAPAPASAAPAAASAPAVSGVAQTHPLEQAYNKGQMMRERLASRQPIILFTVDFATGQSRPVVASTDWINHLLFSPTDPKLLMYCHEGMWWQVDRIWLVRIDDGSRNTLVHKRIMGDEIAGHEFWAPDGRNVWYDLQMPIGQVFYLASYNVTTGERVWYNMQRNEWSIHFNVSRDNTLFCGDGGDPGQVARAPDGEWIYLFRPERRNDADTMGTNLIHPGVFRAERLVNMSKHNYRLEPNVSFSPDQKLVIFRSNMFGPTYVFGVEVAKAQ